MSGPRPGPRLLAATGTLLMTPLGYVMDAIADAGYDAAEVMIGHSRDTQDPDRILSYAAEAGLDVPAVHGPYLLLLRTVLGSGYVKKTLASLDVAAAVGAQVMVAHAPFRWERGARRWLDDGVAEAAADRGVVFGMENLYPVAGRTFSSVVTAQDMEAFPDVVLDTSHCAVAGLDILDTWERVKNRVVHLHISDNFGNGKDSHAPLGTGVLPLDTLLRRVGASDWSGTITLEMDCRAYLDSRDALVSFLARERLKAERLLAGDPALV